MWVNDRFRKSKTHAEEALALESLAELWRQRMEPADRELLIAAIQKSFLDSLVAAQRLEDRLPVIRAALRDARRDAARETLFVSPKLIWKRFLPRVMGIMPWEELKSLVKQALAPAALPAAPSALLAMNLELVRRQLLLEHVAHQESVADLVPVIEASGTLSNRRRGLAGLISQTPENERTECVDDLTNELSKNPTHSTPRKRGV